MRAHRGILILALGIASLVTCPPLGIPVWIMGNHDLRDMDAGTMDQAGRDFTRTGRILGILGTAYFGLWVVAAIAFVIFRLVPFFADRQP